MDCNGAELGTELGAGGIIDCARAKPGVVTLYDCDFSNPNEADCGILTVAGGVGKGLAGAGGFGGSPCGLGLMFAMVKGLDDFLVNV